MSDKQEQINAIEEDLDPWLPRTGEWKHIIEGAASGSSELHHDIKEVERGLKLQKAETKAEISQIAYPAQISSESGESLESYRARALKNLQTLTSFGTPKDIIDLTAAILGVEIREVRLEEVDSKPTFRVKVPLTSIETNIGSESETAEILLDGTAASFGVEVFGIGTLDYISESDYENGNYDTSRGYATLDANGDVTDGGTYSGYYVDTT